MTCVHYDLRDLLRGEEACICHPAHHRHGERLAIPALTIHRDGLVLGEVLDLLALRASEHPEGNLVCADGAGPVRLGQRAPIDVVRHWEHIAVVHIYEFDVNVPPVVVRDLPSDAPVQLAAGSRYAHRPVDE